MSSRVFVVQRPSYRAESGEWADKYDLTPAEHFGLLVDILPRGNVPRFTTPTVKRVTEVLSDFDDDDFLLTVGDPVAIAVASIAAAVANHGRVSLLKWDRRDQEYRAYRVEVPLV